MPKVAKISLHSDSLHGDENDNMAANRGAEWPICFPIRGKDNKGTKNIKMINAA